jgi:superfamily II DNA or RNA helicase
VGFTSAHSSSSLAPNRSPRSARTLRENGCTRTAFVRAVPQDAPLVSASRSSIFNLSGLRPWQVKALQAMDGWERGPFLISAAPGAGKTRPALEAARAMLAAGLISRVVVVCPTTPLTRQWSEAAAKMGVNLLPDADDARPPRGFQGIAVTYARVATAGLKWGNQLDARTLVVADEAHHLGEDLAWGEGFAAAFGRADRWLLLSGTPFRSDATPIPGAKYDAHGMVEPDVSYAYGDAIVDGVCRPVTFIPFDGVLQWQSGDDVIEAGFDDILSTRESSRRYRTAISTDLADGLPRILRTAHERLETVRIDHPDAGGLVIAADGGHARRIAKLLREITGRPPAVVLHDEARAHDTLKRFTDSKDRWIVAVNMVSEGVDIPRLRVGVYATAAKTPLIFRQIVGRFVRTVPGRPPGERSWLYLPAEPALRAHASTVESELRGALRDRGEEIGLLDDEAIERALKTQSEPDGELDFVPLSADVAPQMALFGPPAKAKPVAAPVFAGPPAVAPEPAWGDLPMHEQRQLLRDKRKRLVAELRRKDGRTYPEINQWLNRATGVAAVDKATIEQLERSIEMVLGALDARAPAR